MKEIIEKCETKMKQTMVALQNELNTIRAGRANPAILDRVQVDYYGTMTPIQQMAAVSVSENRILNIQPWDKGSIGDIERAILKSDIGISPANDGSIIRIVFPQPTEERRKELCKQVRAVAEESKIAVRNVRRDANEKLKDLKDAADISEDEIKRSEKEVQTLTDKYIEEVDSIASAKEKEVLEI